MLKPIAQLLLSSYLWKRYRHRIMPLLGYLLACALVFLIHSEYLTYAQTAQTTAFVGLSFILKWVVLIAITFGYLNYSPKSESRESSSAKDVEPKKTDLSPAKMSSDEEDRFAALRGKRKLKGRGDFIIEHKKHK